MVDEKKTNFHKQGQGGFVTSNPCSDPKYQGQNYIAIKTNPNTPKSDHSTFITQPDGTIKRVR